MGAEERWAGVAGKAGKAKKAEEAAKRKCANAMNKGGEETVKGRRHCVWKEQRLLKDERR